MTQGDSFLLEEDFLNNNLESQFSTGMKNR